MVSDREQDLIDAMGLLDEDRVLDDAEYLRANGFGYHDILALLNKGVVKVGETFESGEYFIGDLIVSGMIFRAAIAPFSPDTGNVPETEPIGKVVIGVMERDIHDIGKDIVVSILRAEGFEVFDLGVDVKPEVFVHAVETYEPDVLLLSGILQTSQEYMEATLKRIQEAGLRSKVKILIGGGCVSAEINDIIHADAWAKEPMDTLEFCKRVISEK